MKKWWMKLVAALMLASLVTGSMVLLRFPNYFLYEEASGNGLKVFICMKLFLISFFGIFWILHMSFTTSIKRETMGRVMTLFLQYVVAGMAGAFALTYINSTYKGIADKVLLEQTVYIEKSIVGILIALLLVTDFRKLPSAWKTTKTGFIQMCTAIKKCATKLLMPLYKIWLKLVQGLKWCEKGILAVGTMILSFVLVETFCMNDILQMEFLHIIENLLLYGVIYLIFWTLFHRIRLASIAEIILSVLIGAVNYFTICFRGNPVSFGDLTVARTALSVAGGFKYTVSVDFVIALVMAGIVILCFAVMKEEQKPIKKSVYWIQLVITYAALAGTAVIMVNTGLLYSWIEPVTWNPKMQTEINGYLLSFVADTSQTVVAVPKEYSTSALDAEFAETEETIIAYEGEAEVYPNIIVVMNESFADLSVLGELETDVDYMPYFRSLTEDTIYGNLYVSAYGGSTVYTEFEFLTGNTMAFLPSGTIPYIQYIKKEETPSLARILKQQEVPYETVAIHPFGKSGYNRTVVYNSFGFDDFITEEEFKDCTIYRKYISDEDNYKKCSKCLNKKKKDSLYLFLILRCRIMAAMENEQIIY